MENIYLNSVHKQPHQLKETSNLHYQAASNSILLVHQQYINKYSYSSKEHSFTLVNTWGPIDQLSSKIVLLEDMVEQEVVFLVTEDGSILTVDGEGEVDIKAQNQDGIAAATVSPTQEYIYLLTKNKSLIQLNHQYDLVNEIPIDEHEQMVAGETHFSWRTDGNYFIINYETPQGHKAVTKDLMMSTFISPSKSDPEEDGLVQSVSEKGRKNMSGLVAWQPSGSMVAGVDHIQKGEKKQYRVIFWEKNGLRHLQFNLPENVVEVQQLLWSSDSSILYVKVRKDNNQHELLVYFRANYHWYIKNVVYLDSEDLVHPLSSQSSHHQLLVVTASDIELLEFETRLPKKEWKSLAAEQEFKSDFIYVIDGPLINITDLSKCLMPPPMSMFKAQFDEDVLAASRKRHNLLVLTLKQIFLYDFVKRSVVEKCERGELKGVKATSVRLLSNDSIDFFANGNRYKLQEGQLKNQGLYSLTADRYSISSEDGELTLQAHCNNNELVINDNILTHECSSFIFYHQFLLFTTTTSSMYDKLFVINLPLSPWIMNDESNIKSKLAQFAIKESLNHRLVQRGAKIVAINEGRVAFQMPRGNLEGIYPKIIMIDQVQKHITNKQYSLAFQAIRTHKLDFNLLTDIDPELFEADIQNILTGIKRVDYINLLISQISETLSSELQYILPAKTYDSLLGQFEMVRKGKKVQKLCRLISQTLRNINKEEYILSIFTAQIREGRVSNVLFEIKQMKKQEVSVVVPPHIVSDQPKKKKKQTAQQILQFVCWLVDPNAIYQAALLTYDLQLAAITARCTQKDPKQYIPYFESLKAIKNQVDFRTTICLDLKKYDIAVRQLSEGNEEQKNQSLELIKKHKLFKHGLVIYSGKKEIINVKEFIIEQMLSTGQVNEAYRVSQSVGLHQRCLEIAVGAMDSKKIKESLQALYETEEERKKHARQILEQIKDEVKNKVELAKLYVYLGEYEEAVTLYLRHNFYAKAYKYIWKVSDYFRQKQMKEGFQLCFSIKKNEILKDRKEYLQKYNRLRKVQKSKEDSGIPTTTFRNRDNDDMYSEVSVTSKAASSYTMSTTTGMRKKKDKKRSILTRNVKEGSPLEEQYLLAYLKMLEEKVEDAVKDCKLLIQHLIYVNLIEEAELLRNEVRQYIEVFDKYEGRSFARLKFEEIHPEAAELYYEVRKVSALKIDSFNYLF